MAQDFAKAFYASAAWIKCRSGFMASKHYICERCEGIAEICHHKIYLTPANIHDPDITLNWERLEALCQTCHNIEHMSKGGVCAEGLTFDESGDLITIGSGTARHPPAKGKGADR